MTRKKAALLSAAAALFAVLAGILIYIGSKPLRIVFSEDDEVALFEGADSYDFVESIENGKIVTENERIDTSTVGERSIIFKVKPTFGPEKVFCRTIFVVDSEAPEISFKDRINTDAGKDVDLLAGVTASDNSGEDVTVSVEGEYDIGKAGEYRLKYVAEDRSRNRAEEEFILTVTDSEGPVITFSDRIVTEVGDDADLLAGVTASDNSGEDVAVSVEGEYDLGKAGEYTLKYVASDRSLNRTEEEFTLIVKEKLPPPPIMPEGSAGETFTTEKGYSGAVIDGVTYIEGYPIVNKTYSLPEDYGSGLTAETYAAFTEMAAAAAAEGYNIYIVSGFRSYITQRDLYGYYAIVDGAETADTYSARPGHSEHQSGLAFDLNTTDRSFGETPEGIWLNENCSRFGFILRYPKGKTDETGYIYEPWHFRFVGTGLAGMLYNGGDWITLEDLFGITSEYPG